VTEKINSIIASAFIGIAAYVCTDVIHEVIGHAATNLITGKEIKLLTSVYFRSEPGTVITDLSGPALNLAFSLLIYFILKTKLNKPLLPSLFLLFLMTFNFFWFSGTILESGYSKQAIGLT
jgi:hypothetical protein